MKYKGKTLTTAEEFYNAAEELYEQKKYSEAFRFYEQAAEQGYAKVQNSLGYCYDKGEGVKQDYTKAVYWYQKSADQGDASAQCNLGVCYKKGEGVKQDYTKAVYWFQKSADQGNANGQGGLGDCYKNGEGVKQDYTKAVYWYQKSADQGNATAQNRLGDCYKKGEGVKQDYTKAVYWYQKSADQGYAAAQNGLGSCYYEGQGVKQDYTKAVYWYQKSADQGYAAAQNGLGSCYYEGQGVKQDYTKAVYWFQKSADQGDASAQYNLGLCYGGGKGVNQDYTKAVYWFQKSADQGNASAQYNLGVCYDKGEGVKQDYTKAVYWYQKSADQGDADAQYNLGVCYKYGEGVPIDKYLAYSYYKLAAKQNVESAIKAIRNWKGNTTDYEDYYNSFVYRQKREAEAEKKRLEKEAELERKREREKDYIIPFRSVGVISLILHIVLLGGLTASLFISRGCFTFIFSLFRKSPIEPFTIGTIVLFVSVVIGVIFSSILIKRFDPSKKKKYGSLITFPVLTSILLSVSMACGYLVNKKVTTVFNTDSDTVEISYNSKDGLKFKEYPEAPEKEGYIFAGWKNQYGKDMMEIKKGDFTSYELTPYYASAVKEITFDSVSTSRRLNRNSTIMFPELKNILSYGFDASCSYTFETLGETKLTLSASGGHTTDYSSTLYTSINLGFANSDKIVLTLGASLGANWFSGGEKVSTLASGSTTISNINFDSFFNNEVKETIYFDNNLGEKGSVSAYIPKTKLTFEFKLVKNN